ncbi:hypothetical protein SteCoe_28786 [Stentor coeruleus]|uniref:Translin-associated factor X-interacting protein 1 N-terminal domain-containing protein n=1 Tax=Stentor coeruleus TaxID=5963 RepID=A0A1R2B7G1_9CILI|nr:hypothetical protein SteCoe_28786 [Stentor coeruleus]
MSRITKSNSQKKGFKKSIPPKKIDGLSYCISDKNSSKKFNFLSTLDQDLSPSFSTTKSISNKSITKIPLNTRMRIKTKAQISQLNLSSPIYNSIHNISKSNTHTNNDSTNYRDDKKNTGQKIRDAIENIKQYSDYENRIKACNNALEEIIKEDVPYCSSLKVIKKEYEEYIEYLEKLLEDSRKSVSDVRVSNSRLVMENNRVREYYKKCLTAYEDLLEEYAKVPKGLAKVFKVDGEKMEKNDKNWKKLIKQNKVYETTLGNVLGKLRNYRIKEKKIKEKFREEEDEINVIRGDIKYQKEYKDCIENSEFGCIYSSKRKQRVSEKPAEIPESTMPDEPECSVRTCIYHSVSGSSEFFF